MNMYRLFNVLCWLWNIYEGAELPILLSLYPRQEAYFSVLSMKTCCGAIAS